MFFKVFCLFFAISFSIFTYIIYGILHLPKNNIDATITFSQENNSLIVNNAQEKLSSIDKEFVKNELSSFLNKAIDKDNDLSLMQPLLAADDLNKEQSLSANTVEVNKNFNMNEYLPKSFNKVYIDTQTIEIVVYRIDELVEDAEVEIPVF
jgi:hypothetical protein